MPESLSTQPDSPDGAQAAVRPPGGADRGAEDLQRASRRVRELPPPPKASVEPAELPRVEAERSPPSAWRCWWARIGRRQSSGCVASFLFHFLLLLALALAVEASQPGGSSVGLVSYADLPVPLESAFGNLADTVVFPRGRAEGVAATPNPPYQPPPIDPLRPASASASRSPRTPFGLGPGEPTDWLLARDAAVRGALGGRGRGTRASLAARDGGNAESERAVERGLRWLMAHQRDDGAWDFNHHHGPCQGQCRNPGTEASTTAATAIALLPFLGAGYTHLEGEYRDLVGRGLYYLGSRALLTPNGTDLQEGTMYAQGLAAITFCEAHAMTKDPALKDLAQGAIDFIVYAQDPRGGGWRYTPGEPGDTTVTGWQLMGLKSGQMAGLRVPLPTIYLAQRFLAGVQYYDGAQYGYMDPRPRKTTTAVGLLCRMYTGWRRDHPALQRGVMFLSDWGPSPDNMYYNYYATQVMHHWEGNPWEKWNLKMRDHLIATQATGGHQSGSWHFSGGYGDRGGRLYNTAMAVMTLEVYYRYMPLYRHESVDGEF